jgi:hypothetical protein
MGVLATWVTPDGDYLYQVYGNAAKLVGYATQSDGPLTEVTSANIPYDSCHGLRADQAGRCWRRRRMANQWRRAQSPR